MNERITHTDTSIDDNVLMMFLLIVAFPMIEIHPMGTDRKKKNGQLSVCLTIMFSNEMDRK